MLRTDLVEAFGDEFVIEEIDSRNSFAARGLEPTGISLLGQGIVAWNLKTGKREYFYDFDVDKVNGERI